MKTFSAVIVVMALILTTAVFAQQRGQGRGQGGPRMGAPTAQSSPAPQRGPGMGMGRGMRQGAPAQGARVAPPHAQYRGQAQVRPMPPMGRRGYGPPPPVYRPRGYAPYGGYIAPYYGYGYPHVAFGAYPGGWLLGGVYGGISVFYEKQVVEQSSAQPAELLGPAFLTFEVDAANAEVYVDGAYEGVVEHFIQNPLALTAGEHRIELRLNGEKVGAFKIRPSVGQTVCIRAKLIG